MSSTQTSQSVAIASASFLSGAMMSISLLAVPTCLDTYLSDVQLSRMWERVFHYGHRVLPAIALATGGLFVSIGYQAKAKRWGMVAAGVSTVAIMPFTWIFMFPTNDKLFAMVAESAQTADIETLKFPEVRDLVVRWGRLHLIRSFMPLVGAAIGLTAGREQVA